MNRVIIIHLNGNAYQLEESGYDALRAYLDNAARRLEGNPDKDEIMTDIEQAIAEKFRAMLSAGKNVVMTIEVEGALAEMGPVQDDSAEATTGASAKTGGNSGTTANDARSAGGGGGSAAESTDGPVKRLYTIREGAMIAGVCNGLAAYLGIDVTLVRLVFVLLTWIWGAGILAYVVLALIVPSANTSAEKAAAYGTAATAQEFIRRAREGYYEGLKTLNDKQARRAWKRKFKDDMRNWSRNFEHEMRRSSRHWQSHWHHVPPDFRPTFAAPLFTLMEVGLALLGGFALYSLVTTGVVFGLALPQGIPLWIGILCIIVAWNGLAWPVKTMRWHAYYGGCRPMRSPLGGFGDFLVGLAAVVVVFWLVDHYVPQFHEAMKQVPPLLHRAIDSLQQWLEKR